jgi:hypothetical protein
MDLTASPGEAAGSYQIAGQLGVVSNFNGSCSGADGAGADMAFTFTAPTAGEWEITSAGSEFDSIVYARTTCADPESELACNDDVRPGVLQGALRIQLDQGQTIFIILDTFSGLGGGAEPMPVPYVLTAKPFVPTEPPTINNGTYVIDMAAGTLGFVVEGNDPESDTTGMGFQVYDPMGMPTVRDGLNMPFDNIDHDNDGNFVGTLSLPLSGFGEEGLPEFSRITVTAIDAVAQSSMEVDAAAGQAQAGARGAQCNSVTTTCSGNDVCLEGICSAVDDVLACPAEWPVTPIAIGQDGSAMVNGDNSDSMGGYREGSCGVTGAATEIYSFVAPSAGTYVVSTEAEDLDPEDDANPDTVLFARTLCNFDGGAAGQDLACNDDRGADGEMDLMSQIEFQAEAGQTIFIFVDSFGRMDPWRGPYVLNISRN